MPMISDRDNENNRWKGKRKTKTESNSEVMQAILKVWELNHFVFRLS